MAFISLYVSSSLKFFARMHARARRVLVHARRDDKTRALSVAIQMWEAFSSLTPAAAAHYTSASLLFRFYIPLAFLPAGWIYLDQISILPAALWAYFAEPGGK